MKEQNQREELVPANDPYPLPSGSRLLIVSPEMASSWLSYRNHPKNRPLSKSVSARYQADMEAGRWREATPEGLIFDTDGYVISGQHRLKAQAARTEYRDKIPGWLEGVRTGYDLHKGDPRAHLRNRFRGGFVTTSQSPKRDSMYAVIVKAWNAYVTDTALTVLVHRATEPMPAIEGFEFTQKGAVA